MGKAKEETSQTPKPPGSWWQRFSAWFWYASMVSIFPGPLYMLKELFHKIRKIDYDAEPKRTEETVVLTGGTRGIGRHVLKKMLQLDFNVIMGARKPADGLRVLEELRGEGVQTGTVKCFPLDLKSLQSVKEFANKVVDATKRIDLLINNAGIMFAPYEITEDGYEAHFQVNYLSHFLLTDLLLPKMKQTGTERKTSRCRIVNTSSVAHYWSSGSNLRDCPNPKVYSSYRAYYDSKLCQIVSTKYLNTLMKAEGANVSVYSVHPGIIGTDLYDNMGCFGSLIKWTLSCFRNADEGAEEIMLAAISPKFETEGGCFIHNSKKQKPLKDSEKVNVQKSLWDLTYDCINKWPAKSSS